MRAKIILLNLLLVSLSSFAQQKELKYVGSSTIGNFIKSAEKEYGDTKFIIDTDSESAGGEVAIASGDADIAGVAKTPDSDILIKGIISTLIGWDAIALVVNAANPINGLTNDQLKDIFTGKIISWKELGGSDLPITTFITDHNSASRNIFRSIILKEENYSTNATTIPDSEILPNVRTTPGAIGYISLSFISENTANNGINKISINGQEGLTSNPNYPIKRPLYLLWSPDNEKAADFVKWTLSEHGQEVLSRNFIGNSRFIQQIKKDSNGTLIVYTETSTYESGGNYYYPHKPYEIFNSKLERILYVANHINNTDENPAKISLAPGTYLIRPEMSGGKQHDFWIAVEAEKIATVDVASLIKELAKTDTEKKNEIKREDLGPGKTIIENIKFFSDFRFRFEEDWDSKKTDGTYREDRGRLRIRFRVGFDYNWDEHISFGGRLRAGNSLEQQSPHQTLGGEFEPKTINLDKAYLKGNYTKYWWWVGKNNFPFWKQNELWWHDDVLPEGMALGGNLKLNNTVAFKPTAGYFIVNSLGKNILDDPTLMAVQIAAEINLRKLGITVATGYYGLNDMPNQSDNSGTYVLNYSFLNSGIRFDLKTKIPTAFGLDLMTNLENYSNNTDIPFIFQDQVTGYVANLSIGRLKEKNDFLIGYYYAHIPKFSVVDYFSQDDWLRWNFDGATGTRSSNFSGHEIRLGYAFGANLNTVARAYFVEGIETTGDFKETNNRFRIDFNIGF